MKIRISKNKLIEKGGKLLLEYLNTIAKWEFERLWEDQSFFHENGILRSSKPISFNRSESNRSNLKLLILTTKCVRKLLLENEELRRQFRPVKSLRHQIRSVEKRFRVLFLSRKSAIKNFEVTITIDTESNIVNVDEQLNQRPKKRKSQKIRRTFTNG